MQTPMRCIVKIWRNRQFCIQVVIGKHIKVGLQCVRCALLACKGQAKSPYL